MENKVDKPICGIVMPISAIDGCSEGHWGDVLAILTEAIEDAGFKSNLVSNADEVGVIQKRIIQNLYENKVVVCDVSGKNPNVMFELGMRLAFDKPTIIVKDDKTSYAFDTSPIEHVGYPRDLRFSKIVEFKLILTEKIKATHQKASDEPGYTTFLKHFGEFSVAKIDRKEVSGQEYILEELKNINEQIKRIEGFRRRGSDATDQDSEPFGFGMCLAGYSTERLPSLIELIAKTPGVKSTKLFALGEHFHIGIAATGDPKEIRMRILDRMPQRDTKPPVCMHN